MTQRKQTTLKMCPFCRAREPVVRLIEPDIGVYCDGCGAWMPSRASSDPTRRHTATEGWNRRADG